MIRPSYSLGLGKIRVKSAAVIALLAIFLNLLVPITHGLLSSAEASEVLEICTQNGIELVRVSGADKGMTAEGKACPACADCPLCWFGKENQAFLPDTITQFSGLELIVPEPFENSSQFISNNSQSYWPASRAPPRTQNI